MGAGNRKYKVARVLSTIFALLLLLCGLGVTALGSFFELVRKKYEPVSTVESTLSSLVIMLGLIVIAVGILGFMGIYLEHLRIIKIFLGISVCLLFLELLIGILCFTYTDRTAKLFSNELTFTVNAYGKDNYTRTTKVMDRMQKDLECCGYRNFTDWQLHSQHGCTFSSNNTTQLCYTPGTCCQKSEVDGRCLYKKYSVNGTDNDVKYRGRVYSMGCGMAVMMWVEDMLDILGLASVAVTVPQVFGVAMLYIMTLHVEEQDTMYVLPTGSSSAHTFTSIKW